MDRYCAFATLLLSFCGLAGIASSVAVAQSSPRLVYERSPEAGQCPSEAEFRRAVIAAIERDPFSSVSETVLVVQFRGRSRDWSAEAALIGTSEAPLSTQRLASRSETCGPLGSAMALAVGVALDQVARVPVQPASVPVVVVERRLEVAPPSPPIHLRAAVGGAADFGMAPAAAVSAFAQIEARRAALALALELHLQPRSRSSLGAGNVGSALWAGVAAACFQPGLVGGCLTLWLGERWASAQGVPNAGDRTAIFAAPGLRIQGEFSVYPHLWLRPSAELLLPLTQDVFVVDEVDAWKSPPLAVSLSLALVTDL